MSEAEVIKEGLEDVLAKTYMRDMNRAEAYLLAKKALLAIEASNYTIIPRDRLNRLDGALAEVAGAAALLGSILSKIPKLDSVECGEHNVSFKSFDQHVVVSCRCGWEEIVDRQTDGLMRMRDRASIVARQHIREHQKEG